MKPARMSRRRRDGFTLIEVLLVLVILVILGSIAVPMYISTQQQANVKAAKAQVLELKTPLNLYRMNTGDFPTSLEALWLQPADVNPAKWGGPYLEEPLRPIRGIDPISTSTQASTIPACTTFGPWDRMGPMARMTTWATGTIDQAMSDER